MTLNNITIELVDLLKSVMPKEVLISELIYAGLLSEDFYKLGFNDDDIKIGIAYNFEGK